MLCKTRIPDNKYPNAALRAEGFLFPTEKTVGSLAQVEATVESNRQISGRDCEVEPMFPLGSPSCFVSLLSPHKRPKFIWLLPYFGCNHYRR